MSPCCDSRCMHFRRQKIGGILLALLERVSSSPPLALTEQIHDGEELFLSLNTWDGFFIATAILNVTFKAK